MRIEKRKVSELKYYPGNPRKISSEVLKRLKRSLREFGVVEPLVVNLKNQVIGGNQRLRALRELGVEEVECVIVDLPEDKERALNLALNKISGEWDKDLLRSFIEDMERDMVELGGFDFREVDKIMRINEEEEGEIEFTDELLEEHNYIVLYFDNTPDWLTAKELFGIKTVYAKDTERYRGRERKGVGRVIRGDKVLRMILDKKGIGE